MKRWHSETTIMARRVRQLRSQSWFRPDDDYRWPLSLGRARHGDLIGCNRPRCGLCHCEKLWYRKQRRNEAKREIQDQLAA